MYDNEFSEFKLKIELNNGLLMIPKRKLHQD